MKAIVAFLICMCVFSNDCNAQFISDDGEYHVVAGALISGGTYALVYANTKNKNKAFWYSISASAFAGIAKEIYDSTKPTNNFDSADVAATVVGGLTATVTLSLFVGKRKRRKQTALLHN